MKNNNIKFKDRNVVKFLKDKLPSIAGDILTLVGDTTGVEILENVGKMINKNKSIKLEDKNIALHLIQEEIIKERAMELKDKADARDMQKVALQQDDVFSKRFVQYFAIGWSIISASYIFMITFVPITNTRAADTILGFLLGTIIASMITFFYGSSDGSKSKQNLIDKLQKLVK